MRFLQFHGEEICIMPWARLCEISMYFLEGFLPQRPPAPCDGHLPPWRPLQRLQHPRIQPPRYAEPCHRVEKQSDFKSYQ